MILDSALFVEMKSPRAGWLVLSEWMIVLLQLRPTRFLDFSSNPQIQVPVKHQAWLFLPVGD